MQRTSGHEHLSALEQRLAALLLSAQQGDSASYQAFLKLLCGHLRSFIGRRLGRRPSEVEDLVQEVLLAVHNAHHTYQPDQPVTAWIHAIARYKLADYFRGAGRRDERNEPLDEQSDLFAHSDEQHVEANRDLGRLLQQLPDRERLPIVHVKLEGLSVQEAATLIGQSTSAVKVNIHRGLKALGALIRGKRDHEN
ncbi:sigma-70 family RNA polymerase sigma factor [Pseudomonas sp. KNUC1026]|uniref:sigma-70 family RNA polymerase sigma factor n=1 Tax=Pseudomonas sp. KNUC1026 TaxID=2893890 RepID=UPI001F2C4612|nr:sigma-70 family RNA polymerase sigma factor [Pseudomonas sp. KNUC1026]UFH51192.1 sigma-70 family RNA polymerase sigma factor [Pseudomonas sp. KNUC1026]